MDKYFVVYYEYINEKNEPIYIKSIDCKDQRNYDMY